MTDIWQAARGTGRQTIAPNLIWNRIPAKVNDLITSPAFVVIKAAVEFKDHGNPPQRNVAD